MLPGANASDKKIETELNEILLNSIPKSWSRQAYKQEFDCESIIFVKAANMFDAWKHQNLFIELL